jgi:hypothetical protein
MAEVTCRTEFTLRAGASPLVEVSAMPGATLSPCPCAIVRRAFEFSRLEPQLLALAYEQLLPIIPSTTPTRQPLASCQVGLTSSACTSFQEEQDLETM